MISDVPGIHQITGFVGTEHGAVGRCSQVLIVSVGGRKLAAIPVGDSVVGSTQRPQLVRPKRTFSRISQLSSMAKAAEM